MSKADAKSTFTLGVVDEVSKPTQQATNALEQFKSSIESGQQKIRAMGTSLRSLRGASDEVKAAKESLRAQMDAEKNAISSATLALIKQGTSYDQLASKAKELAKKQEELKKKQEAAAAKEVADRTDKLTASVQAAGGPVASLTSKWQSWSKLLTGSGAEIGLIVGAAAGLVAAIAAVTAGFIAGAFAFGKWVVGAADTTRSMQLMREAALGTSDNARRLGNQVDLLSGKLDTPKAKLNELAVSLSKTRLSGGEIVDTLNAVGQASAAMGDEAGNKVRDLIQRGSLTQRLAINPLELQGTGIDFKDVAATLAKNTNTSVGAAQQALFQGQVKLDVGAKAIRDTIEKRFGEVNAKKLLSLDTQLEKFHENLQGLAKGVNIEPLLTAVQKFFALFDSSKSTTGVAIQQLVTVFGNKLVGAMTTALPIASAFMKGIVIGALEVGTAFFKVGTAIKKVFKDNPALKNIDFIKDATELGKVAVYGLSAALVVAGTAAAALAVSMDAVLTSLNKLSDAYTGIKVDVKNRDAKGVGLNVASGLSAGIELGKGPVQIAADKLGEIALGALGKKLETHSPSKATERIGKYTGEGFVGGIEQTTPDAHAAMRGMVALPEAPRMQAPAPRAATGPITVNLTVNVQGNDKDAANQVRAALPTLRGELAKLFRELLVSGQVVTA